MPYIYRTLPGLLYANKAMCSSYGITLHAFLKKSTATDRARPSGGFRHKSGGPNYAHGAVSAGFNHEEGEDKPRSGDLRERCPPLLRIAAVERVQRPRSLASRKLAAIGAQ